MVLIVDPDYRLTNDGAETDGSFSIHSKVRKALESQTVVDDLPDPSCRPMLLFAGK